MLTKIAGPLPALMKLVDEGKLDRDKAIQQLLETLEKSEKDKRELTLERFWAHHGRFWYPNCISRKVVRGKMAKIKRRFVHQSPNNRFKDKYTTGFISNKSFWAENEPNHLTDLKSRMTRNTCIRDSLFWVSISWSSNSQEPTIRNLFGKRISINR